MVEPEPNDATPFLPERRSLKSLREAAACGAGVGRRLKPLLGGGSPCGARS